MIRIDPKPSRDKVRAERAKLRAQGLRLIQLWVPDVRTSSFAAEARRQSLALARSAQAKADQTFIEAMAERD